MSKESKLASPMMVPKTIVRILFYVLIAPMIYKEAGIVTTIMIGLLSVELAMKGDWLEGIHKLTMNITEKISDLYEFQNDFIKERVEKKNAKSKNDASQTYRPRN